MENKNNIITKRLPLAMKFAISGSAIAVLGALISFLFTLLLKKEYIALGENKAGVSTLFSSMIVYAFFGIVWTCAFLGLAPLMKRVKSKALAINFIVFGALGIAVWLFGLTLPVALDMYLGGSDENTISSYAQIMPIDLMFNHLRQLMMFTILPGLITILGWILVFVAGIIATTANKEELANNRIKN